MSLTVTEGKGEPGGTSTGRRFWRLSPPRSCGMRVGAYRALCIRSGLRRFCVWADGLERVALRELREEDLP
jgi:hypothetical protein